MLTLKAYFSVRLPFLELTLYTSGDYPVDLLPPANTFAEGNDSTGVCLFKGGGV